MNCLPLIKIDNYLKPFSVELEKRQRRAILKELEFSDGRKKLSDCFNNYLYYGLHKCEKGWIFREKAPYAKKIFIYGDFSNWKLEPQYELKNIDNGNWEIILDEAILKHEMCYKLWIFWQGGGDERLPAYSTRVVQDFETKIFSSQVWQPSSCYHWKNPKHISHKNPLIYEAHIGMSSEKPEISTYTDFKNNILPRIKKLGYNAIQLMAIQEHPYYGSFGYQVSNFYAPSSRFGTPEELKELIDTAHALNIAVILDIVHSHSVKNVKEGLSLFDGSDNLYFFSGEKGVHPVWDSRCFDYGKNETISFLLSNVKYWIEEFRFDGMRFDGVTSMIYWNHGIGVDFLNYNQYFDSNVYEDAIVYLTLANKLIHEIYPDAISIAEDVSGMPGMAFDSEKGGIGFNFRMSMGIADFWKQIIKKQKDEDWNVNEIFFRLTDKRAEEQTISYSESHDQSLVGDKPVIMQLIDKEIYFSMNISSENLIVNRGISLFKIIKLLTISLANGGYLNFMGNEFGHPEWIDFPREGNNWSYQYATRKWSLSDNINLRYFQLLQFEIQLIALLSKENSLSHEISYHSEHIKNQTISYMRGNLLFISNLHPLNSYTNYQIEAKLGKYQVVINSDNVNYGGFGNFDDNIIYQSNLNTCLNMEILNIYLPARSCLVLKLQQ